MYTHVICVLDYIKPEIRKYLNACAEERTYVAPAHPQHRPRVHLLGLWDRLPAVLNFPAANLQPQDELTLRQKFRSITCI